MEYSSKVVIGQSAQTFKSKAYLFSRNLRTYNTMEKERGKHNDLQNTTN